jgi:hypothetical protein
MQVSHELPSRLPVTIGFLDFPFFALIERLEPLVCGFEVEKRNARKCMVHGMEIQVHVKPTHKGVGLDIAGSENLCLKKVGFFAPKAKMEQMPTELNDAPADTVQEY